MDDFLLDSENSLYELEAMLNNVDVAYTEAEKGREICEIDFSVLQQIITKDVADEMLGNCYWFIVMVADINNGRNLYISDKNTVKLVLNKDELPSNLIDKIKGRAIGSFEMFYDSIMNL